jgi:organic radical activating enzyme
MVMAIKEGMLGCVEIFRSIQGEGPSAGRPAVFLRTAGCTLHCGFCDTKYAEKVVENLSVAEVSSRLEESIRGAEGSIRLVLTGGEPFLWSKELSLVLERLLACNLRFPVEVETNGTLFDIVFADLIDYFNVSLKLSNSGNPLEKRITKETALLVNYLSAKESRVAYKFVVDKDDDIDEVLYLQRHLALPLRDIWLMPKGATRQELTNRREWCMKRAIDLGANYSDRLHVAAFDLKRGV